MKRISSVLDPNGNSIIGLNYSDYIDHRVLAANVAETHTVPTGAKYVMFNATTPFYARIGGTAAVPAADVTDGTGSMYCPELRSIDAATTISLIAPTTCIVTMEFYK